MEEIQNELQGKIYDLYFGFQIDGILFEMWKKDDNILMWDLEVELEELFELFFYELLQHENNQK